jgi:Ca2+-binding RTX toxin-like protein
LSGSDGFDTLNGGSGDDRLIGGDGKDTLNGGSGVDRFVYETAADSTSVNYDTVKNADFTADKWEVDGNITDVDATIATGKLTTANFDAQLAARADAAHLGAQHAVIFTPTTGDLAAKTFLVIDQNGVAGYQAGIDLVVELTTPSNLGSIDAGDFT